MKPTNSETTTSPKEPLSKTGMQAGGRGLQTQSNSTAPATVEEWQEVQRRKRLQISRLDTSQASRRAAELVAILEIASSKIDRFGWDSMHENIKAAICGDWCDLLSKYTLQEVRDGVASLFKASKGRMRSLNEFQVEEQISIEHRRQLALLPKAAPPDPTNRPDPTPEERQRVANIVKAFGGKRDGRRND